MIKTSISFSFSWQLLIMTPKWLLNLAVIASAMDTAVSTLRPANVSTANQFHVLKCKSSASSNAVVFAKSIITATNHKSSTWKLVSVSAHQRRTVLNLMYGIKKLAVVDARKSWNVSVLRFGMIISASVHVQRSCNAQNLTSGTVIAANVHAPRS